jgi:hypothetical protein
MVGDRNDTCRVSFLVVSRLARPLSVRVLNEMPPAREYLGAGLEFCEPRVSALTEWTAF